MTTATRSRPSTKARKPKAVPLYESPAPPRNSRWGYTLGDMFIEWTEKHLLIPRGPKRGKPMRWSEWQKDFFRRVFTCDKDGNLLYRAVILGIPKKNTKSTMSAALALWNMYGDPYESDPWVVCGANGDRQADIVFGDCKMMCEFESTLLNEVSIRHQYKLRSKAGSGFIERVAASKGRLDGKDASLVVLDELHEMGAENYTILSQAISGRDRAMVVGITTGGDAVESELLLGLYEKGKRIAAGQEKDERFLFIWYGAEEDDDPSDERTWAKSNPNYGVTVTKTTLEHDYRNTSSADFMRYHLNIFVDYAEEPPVTLEQLRVCRLPDFELQPGVSTYVGADVAESRDRVSVVHGQLLSGDDRPCGHDFDEPCLFLKAREWVPPTDSRGRPLEGYQIPQREVREYVMELNAEHEVLTNVWDPWHSKLIQQDLEAEGIVCENIWQSGSRRSGASAELLDLVYQGRLHYCQQEFEDAMLNARVVPASRDGGFYLAKRHAKKSMDTAMAAVNVVYGFQQTPPAPPSVYEERGLRTL